MVKNDTLIFMCDNRSNDQENYIKYSTLINESYAKKHSYDFIFLKIESPKDRHPAWGKILSSIDLIEGFDYNTYVYIDTDCIFNNFDISISEFLNSSPYCVKDIGSNITFTKDSIGNNLPCSGFFVFNHMNLDMFTDWYKTEDSVFLYKHSWEQAVLQNNIHKYNLSIIDKSYFGYHKNNNFLIHLAFTNNNYRLQTLKKHYLTQIVDQTEDLFYKVFNND